MVGVLNSVVHVFMYTYYCVTVLAPNLKQVQLWKRYLTQMQMVIRISFYFSEQKQTDVVNACVLFPFQIQFTLLFFHYLQGLYWGCNYPKAALVAGVIQSFFMFAMFSEFYYNQYIRPNLKGAYYEKREMMAKQISQKINVFFRTRYCDFQ